MDFSLDKSLSHGLQDCECAWESCKVYDFQNQKMIAHQVSYLI